MGTISLNGASLGNGLQALLTAQDIVPGDAPSYELCKQIYAFHPLGAKMVDAPIEAAQSQGRKIAIPGSPEDRVRDAFVKQWEKDGIDGIIANTAGTARMYGIASTAVLTEGESVETPLKFEEVWKKKISINVFDPLNTAGSLVLNQDPNAMDFQKHADIRVNGKVYARSRSVTIINEKPLYIEYSASAFGFSGRSVYQRPLYPLKSFVNTMVTDDMVSKKAGLLIAFIKGAGSIVDNLMARFAGIKRSLLKQGVVDEVLSMGPDDKVESLNLQNLDGAYGNSRTNILKNIATAAKMPAVMLENETLTEGFGEGTEDAKVIAQFVAGIRKWMSPLYGFFDPIVQRRAWNPDFIAIIKKEFAEQYAGRTDEEIFYEWQNAFSATWPNLLEEPESEKIKVEDVKFKATLAFVEIVAPLVDPINKKNIVAWAADAMNENKLLFGTPLILDEDALADWEPPQVAEPTELKPFSAADAYTAAVQRLPVKRDVARKVANG